MYRHWSSFVSPYFIQSQFLTARHYRQCKQQLSFPPMREQFGFYTQTKSMPLLYPVPLLLSFVKSFGTVMGITTSGNFLDLHKLPLIKCTFLSPEIHLTKKNVNCWKHYLIGFTVLDAFRPFIFEGTFALCIVMQ